MSRHEPVFFVRLLPDGPKALRPGRAERVDLTDQVLSFEYHDKDRGADVLRLTVDNYDLSNHDDPVWKKGNYLEVTWGWAEELTVPRIVVIRKVNGFQQLAVEAHGREVTFNRETKTRTFENMTRSQVVRTIAREAGFKTDDVVHVEDTEVVYDVIAQTRLTDAQFMRRLCHKEGFEWYVDFDGFHFHRRDLQQRPLRTYSWHESPDRSNFTVVSIENDITGRPGRVKVKGRNPLTHEDVNGDASNDSQANNREVMSRVVEVIDLESGESLGDVAVAQERTEPTVEDTNAGAQREAAAKFRRAQQVAVKMKVTAEGDPLQVAKTVIQAGGMGKRLSQKYYVKSVTHRIDSGYTMSMDWISDGSGGHSTKSKRVSGLEGIDVGPKTKGRRGPEAEKTKVDTENPRPLQPFEVVDLETGNGKTIYRNTKGREKPQRTQK